MREADAQPFDVEPTRSHLEEGLIKGPVGLGGWLVLPFLHLAANFALTAYNLFQALQGYDGLIAIAAGGSEKLDAMRLPVVLSLVASLLMIVMAPAGFYAMITRSIQAPRIMIGFYLATSIAGGLEVAADHMMSTVLHAPADMPQAARLPGTIFWSIVWILYFLNSRRVANTFRPHEAIIGKKVAETFA